MKGAFITATGTGVGKTWLTSALSRACVARGLRVTSIKPMETGVDPEPLDAIELARACRQPALARAEGLYRASPPLAPYAVERAGGPAIGSLERLAERTRELGADADCLLVEGAGGVLVPLDAKKTIADFASILGLPILLVAENALGVLSYTLTAVEALRARGLEVQAIALQQIRGNDAEDISPSSNAAVLANYLHGIPIVSLPQVRSISELIEPASELCEILDFQRRDAPSR